MSKPYEFNVAQRHRALMDIAAQANAWLDEPDPAVIARFDIPRDLTSDDALPQRRTCPTCEGSGRAWTACVDCEGVGDVLETPTHDHGGNIDQFVVAVSGAVVCLVCAATVLTGAHSPWAIRGACERHLVRCGS